MSTHQDRIAYASRNNRCFACANYAAPLATLSANCLTGGLDPVPAGTYRHPAHLVVRWDNGCPRFVALAPVRELAA